MNDTAGKIIKEYRKTAGITQWELAENINEVLRALNIRASYSKGAVCNWERGRSYPDRRVIDIMRDNGIDTQLAILFKHIWEVTK